MISSFDCELGEHTIRITQLSTVDATFGADVTLNVIFPALGSMVPGLFKAFKAAEVADGTERVGALLDSLDVLLENEIKLRWPVGDPGVNQLRSLFLANARLRSGTTPDGKEVWFPLKDCTEKVFGGRPGLRLAFDFVSWKANFRSFFSDAKSGGAELRPAG